MGSQKVTWNPGIGEVVVTISSKSGTQDPLSVLPVFSKIVSDLKFLTLRNINNVVEYKLSDTKSTV